MIFDKEGSTALHIAVQNGNLNVSHKYFVFLVSYGYGNCLAYPMGHMYRPICDIDVLWAVAECLTLFFGVL